MAVEDFHAAIDVANGLFSRRVEKRERAASELAAMGPVGVRLTAYTIEEIVADHGVTDDDVKRHDELASSVVMRIGRDAVAVLEDLATDDGCSMYINLWAQHMVFEILGLDGVERQRACHHLIKFLLPRRGRDVWVCGSCNAEFGDGEHATEEIAPVSRRDGKAGGPGDSGRRSGTGRVTRPDM